MGRGLDFAQTGKSGLQGELNLIFIESVRGAWVQKTRGPREAAAVAERLKFEWAPKHDLTQPTG